MNRLAFIPEAQRQPTCPRCDRGITVDQDISSTIVEHCGWIAEYTDSTLRSLRCAGDLWYLVCAWMASEHHEAALELCGEIVRMYRRTQA